MGCFWLAIGLGIGLVVGFVVLGRSGWAAPLAICLRRRVAAFCWGDWDELLDSVDVLICESVRFMLV